MAPRRRPPLRTPLIWPLWILFLFMGMVLFALAALHVLTVGFGKLGLSPFQVFLILAGSFFGSAVNIPLKRYSSEETVSIEVRSFFGMRYSLPVKRTRQTILAVNVGGCVVPVLVSVYLLTKIPDAIPHAAFTTAVCAGVTYWRSRVVEGVGIAVPFFLPPLVSAGLALLFAHGTGTAAPVAYVTGSLGTLIGGDLLNLGRITKLGGPVASIGGAGTWDGIFLSGLLASVLTF